MPGCIPRICGVRSYHRSHPDLPLTALPIPPNIIAHRAWAKGEQGWPPRGWGWRHETILEKERVATSLLSITL